MSDAEEPRLRQGSDHRHRPLAPASPSTYWDSPRAPAPRPDGAVPADGRARRPHHRGARRHRQDRHRRLGGARPRRAASASRPALDGAGVPFKELSLAEADARRVEEVIAFDDPAGTPLEVFHGPVLDHSPVVTPFGARFVTGDQGLGHVVLPALDVPGVVRLLHRGTGIPVPRRVPGAGATRVRSAAGAVPRHQRAPPQPGDLPGAARCATPA